MTSALTSHSDRSHCERMSFGGLLGHLAEYRRMMAKFQATTRHNHHSLTLFRRQRERGAAIEAELARRCAAVAQMAGAPVGTDPVALAVELARLLDNAPYRSPLGEAGA